jgi:hypothetical protein
MSRSTKRYLCIGVPILVLNMAGLFGSSGYRAFIATFGMPQVAQLTAISNAINVEAPKATDDTTTLVRTYVEGNAIVYRYALTVPMPEHRRSYAQSQKQANFSAACDLLRQFGGEDVRVAHQYVDTIGNYAGWTLDAAECEAKHNGGYPTAGVLGAKEDRIRGVFDVYRNRRLPDDSRDGQDKLGPGSRQAGNFATSFAP